MTSNMAKINQWVNCLVITLNNYILDVNALKLGKSPLKILNFYQYKNINRIIYVPSQILKLQDSWAYT